MINNNKIFSCESFTIEEKLKESLGTKVSVTGKENGAGKIEIEFYSNDDLERLLDILK